MSITAPQAEGQPGVDDAGEGFDLSTELGGTFVGDHDITTDLSDLIDGDPAGGEEGAGETEEKPDGEKDPAEQEEEDDQSKAPEITDDLTIDIDGDSVSIADLKQARADLATNQPLIDRGVTYVHAMDAFNKSPDGAKSVIQAMINAAIEVHGEDFDAASVDLKALNPAEMTETERTLYAQVRRLQAEQVTLAKTYSDALEELKPLATEARMRSSGQANAELVNRAIKDANITPDEITKMMRETKVDDPVKAYKLATYDQVRSAKTEKTHEERHAKDPKMPRGGAPQTFSVKGLTADEIGRRMAKGWTPIHD